MKTLNLINLGLSLGMTCAIPFIVAFGPSPLDQTQFAFHRDYGRGCSGHRAGKLSDAI
jgi:hypothetical protein